MAILRLAVEVRRVGEVEDNLLFILAADVEGELAGQRALDVDLDAVAVVHVDLELPAFQAHVAAQGLESRSRLVDERELTGEQIDRQRVVPLAEDKSRARV